MPGPDREDAERAALAALLREQENAMVGEFIKSTGARAFEILSKIMPTTMPPALEASALCLCAAALAKSAKLSREEFESMMTAIAKDFWGVA